MALLGVIAAGLLIGGLVMGLRTVTVHLEGAQAVSCGAAWHPEGSAAILRDGAMSDFMARYPHAAQVHFVPDNINYVTKCNDSRSTSLVLSIVLIGFALLVGLNAVIVTQLPTRPPLAAGVA